MKAEAIIRARRAGTSRFSFILHPSYFILAATVFLVAGCGFQLRGQATLPFHTLYVQAAPTSPFGRPRKRALQSGSSTQLADRADQAEAVLQILGEFQEKEILSLGAGGRVREFQLRYCVQFRLTDEKNREHIPLSELILKRDYS